MADSSFKNFSRLWNSIIPLLLVGWAFLLVCTPLWTTDLWWHLRTGQLILERGEFPVTDWYSFSDAHRRWIDLHWGFQMLVTLVHKAGGIDLLVITKAVCFALTVGIAWFASGDRLPAWAKAACWILPVISLSGRSFVRPEMLSQIFLALWLLILYRARSNSRLLWFLPAIQLVWVNCHAFFVLGLVIGGTYLADRVARNLFGGQLGLAAASKEPKTSQLVIVGALVLAAAFCNPYFAEGALYPYKIWSTLSLHQDLYSVRLGELRPPIEFVREYGLLNLQLLALIGVWLTTFLSFVGLGFQKRIDVMRLLIFIGFSHLCWLAGRNSSLLSLTSGVILCQNLSDWRMLRSQGQGGENSLSVSSVRETLNAKTSSLYPSIISVVFLLLIVSVVTGGWYKIGEGQKSFGLGETPYHFIHGPAKFAGQPGFPKHAFVAQLGQAAVYIYHNGPERKVFMDARLEVASPETYRSFEIIRDGMAVADRSWESTLRDKLGRLPVVILDSRHSRPQINGLLNLPNWRMVFADETGAVFIEKTLAEELDLPPADITPLVVPPGERLRDAPN